MGIVVKLFQGRDGVVRAVRLRAGKSCLGRAVHHLFPLEGKGKGNLGARGVPKQQTHVNLEIFKLSENISSSIMGLKSPFYS